MMKNNVIKRWMIISVVLLLTFGHTIAQQSPINLSGSWQINLAKSDFGKAPAFTMHAQLILTQTTDSIIVKAIGTDQNSNPYSVIAKYALDGKATERELPDNKKLISAMQWSTDKTMLLKNQRYISTDNPDQPYKMIKETWSLSNDEKTLTIDQNVVASSGNYSIKAVFDKQ